MVPIWCPPSRVHVRTLDLQFELLCFSLLPLELLRRPPAFNWDCIFESSFYYCGDRAVPGSRCNPRVVVALQGRYVSLAERGWA